MALWKCERPRAVAGGTSYFAGDGLCGRRRLSVLMATFVAAFALRTCIRRTCAAERSLFLALARDHSPAHHDQESEAALG